MFPLDCRWIYYEQAEHLLNRPRPELGDNVVDNEFFVTVPQPRRVSESRPLLVSTLFDLHVHDRGSVGFPRESRPGGLLARSANLHAAAWEAIRTAWNLRDTAPSDESRRGLVGRLFRVALVVLHAPQYQADHQEALAQDWTHLPIPKDKQLFDRMADLGHRIATLLDPMHDPDPIVAETLGKEASSLGVVRRRGAKQVSEGDLVVSVPYHGAAKGKWVPRAWAEGEASNPAWGAITGDLYINSDVYFANVPEQVWRYELGGYPVLRKWLGYRQAARRGGRPLTLTERQHFRSMAQRIAALLVLHGLAKRALRGNCRVGVHRRGARSQKMTGGVTSVGG